MRFRDRAQLAGPYLRRPLAEWAPKSKQETRGRHRGIPYANVHAKIGNLVLRPEGGLDIEMYRALHNDFSLDELFDLEEIEEVARSHRDAAMANAEAKQKPKGKKRNR